MDHITERIVKGHTNFTALTHTKPVNLYLGHEDLKELKLWVYGSTPNVWGTRPTVFGLNVFEVDANRHLNFSSEAPL